MNTIIECADHFVVGKGKRTWTESAVDGKYNFYFPDFFLRDKAPFFYHEETLKLSDLSCAGAHELLSWSAPNLQKYERQYESFKSNGLKKAVLYATREAKGHINAMSLVASALKNKGRAVLYGFWDENQGMLGLTPEILFEKNAQGVRLEAIAGTKQGDPFTPKEEEEHQIVIDGIKEALHPFGEVQSFPQELLPYGPLMHLKTPLHLKADVPFIDLVKSLHPTPALGTYPKDWPFLESINQETPRGRYGAPAGFVYGNEARCLVAIRNIQWKDGRIIMAAGGGVTKDSDKESEWEEILRKFNAIQSMLSI